MITCIITELETRPLKIPTGSWDVAEQEISCFQNFSLGLSKNKKCEPTADDVNMLVGLGCSSSLGGSLEEALPVSLGHLQQLDPSPSAVLRDPVPQLGAFSLLGKAVGLCGFPSLPGVMRAVVGGVRAASGAAGGSRWGAALLDPSSCLWWDIEILERRSGAAGWALSWCCSFTSSSSRRQMWLRQLPGSGSLRLASAVNCLQTSGLSGPLFWLI